MNRVWLNEPFIPIVDEQTETGSELGKPADLESLKGETESLNEDRQSYKSVHSQTDPEVEEERPDVDQPEVEEASGIDQSDTKSEGKQR